MGFAYDDLLTAAILLDNPGVTKEELVGLIEKYFIPERTEHWQKEKDLGYSDLLFYLSGLEDLAYLYGLSGLLGIGYSDEFNKFQGFRKEEHGLVMIPPSLHISGGVEIKDRYRVEVHEGYEIEGPRRVLVGSYSRLKKGEMWLDGNKNRFEGKNIIEKVFREERYNDERHANSHYQDDEFGNAKWVSDVVLIQIVPKIRNEHFDTLDQLVEEWPLFHPERVYDFSQTEGELLYNQPDLRWIQKDGKYYLDEKRMLDKLPSSYREVVLSKKAKQGFFGYTDLILTAEAIKHREWGLLKRDRTITLEQFLKKHPDSLERYQKAVWDSHTSLFAEQQRMTHSELLRLRLLRGI